MKSDLGEEILTVPELYVDELRMLDQDPNPKAGKINIVTFKRIAPRVLTAGADDN